MKRMTMTLAFGLLILNLGVTHAVEKKPLPDFLVTSSQGHQFSSTQLAGRNRWLLILVSPTDPLSERLLGALQKWPESKWLAGTTIMVEASPKEAQEFLQKQLPAQLDRLKWVSDEPLHATNALKLQGLPVLLGMDQAEMQWTISGVLSDPATLESIVQSWLR